MFSQNRKCCTHIKPSRERSKTDTVLLWDRLLGVCGKAINWFNRITPADALHRSFFRGKHVSTVRETFLDPAIANQTNNFSWFTESPSAKHTFQTEFMCKTVLDTYKDQTISINQKRWDSSASRAQIKWKIQISFKTGIFWLLVTTELERGTDTPVLWSRRLSLDMCLYQHFYKLEIYFRGGI